MVRRSGADHFDEQFTHSFAIGDANVARRYSAAFFSLGCAQI